MLKIHDKLIRGTDGARDFSNGYRVADGDHRDCEIRELFCKLHVGLCPSGNDHAVTHDFCFAVGAIYENAVLLYFENSGICV